MLLVIGFFLSQVLSTMSDLLYLLLALPLLAVAGLVLLPLRGRRWPRSRTGNW